MWAGKLERRAPLLGQGELLCLCLVRRHRGNNLLLQDVVQTASCRHSSAHLLTVDCIVSAVAEGNCVMMTPLYTVHQKAKLQE